MHLIIWSAMRMTWTLKWRMSEWILVASVFLDFSFCVFLLVKIDLEGGCQWRVSKRFGFGSLSMTW